MSDKPIKPLEWIASSLKDMRAMPEDVRDVFGKALFMAQLGGKHDSAKPLKGFGGAGVLEVVEDHSGDTFRAVYAVRFANTV
jgi:phage-related protein